MFGYGYEEDDDPTDDDIGVFIPQAELESWWKMMQMKHPQIFPASDPCPRQLTKDTKLRTYFDGDKNKEMNAVVLGSKMKVETLPPPSSEYPMYVVRCPPDSYELSYIHLTAAHEEDG